jgi:putative transposase
LLWLTDINEHWTAEGKLYLCAIKDVYSGRIVGYSIDSRMKASLAVAALRNAIARRSPVGTVVHSDRGSQPAPTPSCARSPTTGWSVRWAGSAPAATTPRWSPCSRCCRRTCST